MSAREGNSFVFPRDSMFLETKSRFVILRRSVLLYSDEIKIKKIFIQQLYFVIKKLQTTK